jgi:hypothetical protein
MSDPQKNNNERGVLIMHLLFWYNLYIYKTLNLPCPKTNVNTTAVKYMLAIFHKQEKLPTNSRYLVFPFITEKLSQVSGL